MAESEPEGRRWDDEIDDEGLPISAGAKRAVALLDERWGARYERLARRVTWMMLVFGVGIVIALTAQVLVIRENARDSARQDTAILGAQKRNCAGFSRLRDAFEIILLRAYGSLDRDAAKALALRVHLPPEIVLSAPSPQARRLTKEQRAIAGSFYVTSIDELHALHCRASKKTKRT